LPYATTRDFWIPAAEPDGMKTFYVQFRGAAPALTMSAVYSDSILLDRAAPTGMVLINGGAATTDLRDVTLSLSATDANTVTDMRLRWGNQAWGAWVPYATTQNTTMPPWNGANKTVSVQFRDAAGNVSTAVTDSIQLADVTPPTGSVLINGGAATTNVRPVTLTFSATDANGVTSMRVSWASQPWGPWTPYAATATADIIGGAGTKYYRVQFRDGAGVVSTIYTDTITYAP